MAFRSFVAVESGAIKVHGALMVPFRAVVALLIISAAESLVFRSTRSPRRGVAASANRQGDVSRSDVIRGAIGTAVYTSIFGFPSKLLAAGGIGAQAERGTATYGENTLDFPPRKITKALFLLTTMCIF